MNPETPIHKGVIVETINGGKTGLIRPDGSSDQFPYIANDPLGQNDEVWFQIMVLDPAGSRLTLAFNLTTTLQMETVPFTEVNPLLVPLSGDTAGTLISHEAGHIKDPELPAPPHVDEDELGFHLEDENGKNHFIARPDSIHNKDRYIEKEIIRCDDSGKPIENNYTRVLIPNIDNPTHIWYGKIVEKEMDDFIGKVPVLVDIRAFTDHHAHDHE